MEIGDDAEAVTAMSRKEKRKLLKNKKRQQRRKEIAVREKEAEERRLSDAEVQSKLRQLEGEELEKTEMDRKEFEERERMFLQALELNRRPELQEYRQEPARERQLGEVYRGNQFEDENTKEMKNESDWEYAEEGPAEIIWKGNEIIVKKKRVRVPKKNFEEQNKNEDVVRPISNPLAPQSEDFEDCKSVQQILDTVAQEVPYFGTEQDKAHCPFHLKTGACRFGTHCSRVHFYPDKSCTLLMKNMYGGPGLMWEQDEGLEHTDEEIEHCFEEFYEDVHTEFLKFGEIVNFKVCRNGSSHLRGNVYVHYKYLESAVLSYNSTNGRYFAGKQVLCEFVNLTRWKVAICGEYMRSRLMTCSRGSTCNFIHCFRNPGGDYEWADWDRKPPAYWINKMNALFGNYDGYGEQLDQLSRYRSRSAARSIPTNADRHYSRSRPKELDWRHSALYDDNDYRNSGGGQWRSMGKGRENSSHRERHEVKMGGADKRYVRGESCHLNSGDDKPDREVGRTKYEGKNAHKNCRRSRWLRVERNSESSSDGDISVEDGRERFRQDYKSLRRKPDSNGKGSESDLGREWSGKDGSEEYPEDETISSQKTRDSCKSDYERDIREDIDKGNLEYYHEDNICKHHRHRSKSILQEDRRRSSRGSKQAHSTGCNKQRKRERSHPKSESRRSRSRKDRPGPNVTLSDKDAWDRIKVNDELVTAHFERKTCNHEDSEMELEFKNEQACRLAALEKLQQLQKLPISLNSRHVEGAIASSKVSGDNNEI